MATLDDTYVVTHSVAGLFRIFNLQKKVCVATGCTGDWAHAGSRPDGHGMPGVTEQLFRCNGSCGQLPIAFKVSEIAPVLQTGSRTAARGNTTERVNEVEAAAIRMVNKLAVAKPAARQNSAGTGRSKAARKTATDPCVSTLQSKKQTVKAPEGRSTSAQKSETAAEEADSDSEAEPYAIGVKRAAPLHLLTSTVLCHYN